MSDPFAKIKPITFLRTIEALLLRPDCHDKMYALNEARSLFQVSGDKNKVMLQLLACYPHSDVVTTMQKLMAHQETDVALPPQVLLQAAMSAIAPAPAASPAPQQPPPQQSPQPSTTPPPHLQQQQLQQLMMGGGGAPAAAASAPRGRGRPPKALSAANAASSGSSPLPGSGPASLPANLPGLSNLPGFSNIPGLGNLPGLGNIPGLGNLPGGGSLPNLGSLPPDFANLPGLGNLPGISAGFPGLPGGLPGIPGGLPGLTSLPGIPGGLPGLPGLGAMPGALPSKMQPPDAPASKRAKHDSQAQNKTPPPRPGGVKAPQAPQLAADDVTHGGAGALAEQDVLTVDELALEQEALLGGQGGSRSLKDVMPRYKEEYVLSMPPLYALLDRIAAQHGLQGVDPGCSVLIALTVEAHLSRLLMATAKVAGQRTDPARNLPSAAPRGRDVSRRLKHMAGETTDAAGPAPEDHQQSAPSSSAQAAQQQQQQHGHGQQGQGQQPAGAPLGQSLLPFRRTRPLLVKASKGPSGGAAPGIETPGTGGLEGGTQGEGAAGGENSTPPPEQLVRPLGPSLLLRGPLSDRGGGGPEREVPELTLEDMLIALERDTTLGRNRMVWRLHNKLLLGREQAGAGQQRQQQQQQQQQQQHGGVS